MSLKTLETAILAGARELFKNTRLRHKDIQEWSTGEVKPQAGEVVARVENPGVNVAIKKEHDKRKVEGK